MTEDENVWERDMEDNRDMFKEEDASPSSTTSTMTASEDVISSSSSRRMLCDERSASQSPLLKEKVTVDSPPDDVKAFFGHPLTRATNALNGDEVDTNADAEALLHEYKYLHSIQRDEIKVSGRLNGFLDIVRSVLSHLLLFHLYVSQF
ncbi:unnamed protein product [Candidula unifasciata]|uniref:Uncharacterized protein n=1 Tax=Candidula unifasciata TaxID=100452 RepID=A0A8S3YTL3_9EUPU|nr:unnamed protein product [Candidula unifasciata]